MSKYLSLINSTINLNVHSTPELHSLQYEIKKEHHSFLIHDSFVDCSDIKEIPFDEIEEKIIQSPAIIKGKINEQDLNQCLSLLKTSPKLTRRQLKKFNLL